MTMQMEIDGRTIEISKPKKILFPGIGAAKADLASYFRDIAPLMVPLIEGHPLNLQRFPDGVDESGFFQQDTPEYFPDWIERASLQKREGGSVDHLLVRSGADLAFVANQGGVCLHMWQSRADVPENPTRLIFDLDPPAAGKKGFRELRFAARTVREILEKLGLEVFVMTTGSKGLHVVSPLDGGEGFDEVRDFARRVSKVLAERHPDRLTTEQRKNKRKGRLFLDVLRNSYGHTAVAPYSTRVNKDAPVATPLDWEELDRSNLTPDRYNLKNIFRRLGNKKDPWRHFRNKAAPVADAARRLEEMAGA